MQSAYFTALTDLVERTDEEKKRKIERKIERKRFETKGKPEKERKMKKEK